MMAMVTNRLVSSSVLVILLILSSLGTSRSLRMKREIRHNTTSINTTEKQSPTNASNTTVDTSQMVKVTLLPGLNISSATVQQPELNHTLPNYSTGTESLTVHPPTEKETTLHTQLPTTNGTGHITEAGSSAPTFPASLEPDKVTQKNMTTVKTTHAKVTTAETTTRKSTTSTTHVCPTAPPRGEGLVSRCLIAIASMAALTTIFIISTICLATKLSGYRYRHKAQLLQETEMVCISALMNDSDHPVPKPRHPKSNGALIPNTVDGDPEGDNLTLDSFVHDNEGPL